VAAVAVKVTSGCRRGAADTAYPDSHRHSVSCRTSSAGKSAPRPFGSWFTCSTPHAKVSFAAPPPHALAPTLVARV
jgi:hypothetical protein